MTGDAAGPLIIVGRPHSGSRLLAEILQASGVAIGAELSPGFLDAMPLYQRFVAPVMTSRYFADLEARLPEPEVLRWCGERLADALARHRRGAPAHAAWGWKFCETLFVLPIVRRLLPGARVIHLVRDGRDVCLSDDGYFQLTGHTADPAGWEVPALGGHARPGAADPPSYRAFCLAVTVGDAGATRWRDLALDDRQALSDHRFAIQMHVWRRCVEEARRLGRPWGAAYHELRYEALCTRPLATVAALLDQLGLALRPEVRRVLERVDPTRMRRWERARLTAREARDFADAVALGGPLLAELGDG